MFDAQCDLAALVYGEDQDPDAILRSNRETIARLGNVTVATLGFIAAPEPAVLGAAAAGLELERWLAVDS